MEKSNIEKITRTEDLPFIPERIRFFAYRYAMECKEPRKFWAAEYGVKVCTIERWLRHEGVRDYIEICRNKVRKDINYLEEIRRKLGESQRKRKSIP